MVFKLVSAGPTWHKLCDIPTLPTLYPTHWIGDRTPYKVPCYSSLICGFALMSWSRRISSAWRNSMAHLWFVRTSVSDAILPDCSSAAMCRTATKLTNYWRKGSTSTVIAPASASNVVDQHNKIEGITFGAPFPV
jgi:hypothetical protein